MEKDPQQRKALREEKARQRKEKEAKQRKLMIRLAIVAAALLVCGALVLILVLPKNSSEPEVTEPAVQTPAEESQPPDMIEETEPEDSHLNVIHVVAAGDVNVTDKVVAAGGLAYDYTDTFMDVAYLFGDADLSMVNLEGNLCGAPYGTDTASAPPGLMDALDNAGVDLVQLANSYSINRGVSGLAQTINAVRSAGMEPLGVYEDQNAYREAKGYTLCTVEGVRIAVVAFTKGMDGMALPPGSENCVNLLYEDYDSTYQNINTEGITEILDAVEQARPDITIAMLHWGSEYNDTISPSQEDIVEILQAGGVDAIIGTHPHYVQRIDFDEEAGTLVAYSLGDLISDGERSGTQYSVVLDLEITKNTKNGKVSLTGYSYTPIYTVADKNEPLRVVRIREAIAGFESYFIGRASQQTYEDMLYALQRIEARTTGQ